MAKIDIEQLKADREAGTLDSAAYGDETNVAMVGGPNAVNRVARINDYEAALIEAVELLQKAQKANADFTYDCGIDDFLERFK